MAGRRAGLRSRWLNFNYAVFTGLYTSTTRTDIIRDDIQVLFCDFYLDAENPNHCEELTNYPDELRALMMEALNEEVWIIYHPVARITGKLR